MKKLNLSFLLLLFFCLNCQTEDATEPVKTRDVFSNDFKENLKSAILSNENELKNESKSLRVKSQNGETLTKQELMSKDDFKNLVKRSNSKELLIKELKKTGIRNPGRNLDHLDEIVDLTLKELENNPELRKLVYSGNTAKIEENLNKTLK